MKLKNLSLLQKALLGVVLILLPLSISFFHSYFENREYIMDRVLEDLAAISEAHEGQVYQFMETVKGRARDFSTDGAVVSGLKGVLKGEKGSEKKVSGHLTKNKLPLDRHIDRIHVISADGKVLASTGASSIGEDLSTRPFFIKGKLAPVIDEQFGNRSYPEVAVAAPVADPETGAAMGVIAVFHRLSGLSRVLTGEMKEDFGAPTRGKGRETMDAYLVNRDGLMITGSVYTRDAVLRQRVASAPVAECLERGREYRGFYKDYRGVEVAGASVCLPSMQWVLLVEVSSEEVLSPAGHIARDAALGTASSAAIIGLLFLAFYRNVIARLSMLSGASATIAGGNYDIEVATGSNDEIGVLSGSFNRMSAEIRARTTLLKESEEKYRSLISHIPDATWTATMDGRVIFMSRNAENIFGHSAEEVCSNENFREESVHPEDLVRVKGSYEALFTVNSRFDEEYRVRAKDGRWLWVHDRARATYEKDGVMLADGVLSDITGRKLAERKASMLSVLYSVLSRVNETIARTRDMDRIYDEACRSLVEEGGFLSAWIGFCDPVSLDPITRCSRGRGSGAEPHAGLRFTGMEPVGAAVREGRPVVCNDIEKLQEVCAWRRSALALGFRSSAALPLRREGKAVGALALYSGEPGFFGTEEVILLETLASDLSFALESVEFERQGRQKDEEVKLLQSLSLAIKDAEDFRAALKVALRKVCEFTGWSFGEVWIPRPGGTAIGYGSIWYGAGEEYGELAGCSKDIILQPGSGVPGKAWSSRKSVWVSDISRGGGFARPELAGRFGIKAAFGIPIIAEDRVLAVLVFLMSETKQEDRRFTDLVSAVSAQLGSVMQRKLAVDARQELQTRYEELLNSITVGVYRDTGDGDGGFVEVNRALVAMLDGASREDILGRKAGDFFVDRSRRAEIAGKVMEYGFVRNEEAELSSIKGKRIWVLVSAVRKPGAGGPVYFDGVFEDITERKLLEEQLRHSQKLEAVGQLAGGVAHDFNNILTAIIGYGNLLLLKRGGDEMVRNYADHVLTLAEKASNLTQSLLAFSRKQIMNYQPLDLNGLIRRVEKILARLIGEDIHLRTAVEEGEVVVKADSTQLELVLMNLVTNARDAMPGGGTLTISTEVVEAGPGSTAGHGLSDAGEYALVTVADTGNGMDEETRKRIFEPFFTTKGVGKGTGLGLSVVYGIIKQHGGDINVCSEPGTGSIFRIYLPILKSGETKAEPRGAGELRGGTETILLAEDEREVRSVNRSILEEFGYTVIEAADGEEAVRRFMENRDKVRLLVLDMIMPKKSGKEAYEEIARAAPEMKVMFTSGYAADLMKAKGAMEPGADFVSKPVSMGDLLKKVREILDQ